MMKKTFTLLLALVVSMLSLQASAAMYIVGNAPFGEWNPAAGVKMTYNGNGMYTYTATISGTVYFVFGTALASSSSDWDTFNNNYRYGPVGSDKQVAVNTWVTTQKSSSGAYYFTGNGSEYVFTFDLNNEKFQVGSGSTS